MKNSMLSIFSKIIFPLKKPQIIIVSGNNQDEVVFKVLNQYLKVKKIKDKLRASDIIRNEVLIFESQVGETESFEFLIDKSKAPVLLVTSGYGEIGKITRLAEVLPDSGFLLLNSDDEAIRGLIEKSAAESLTFGFQEKADFQVTDVKNNGGTNFKINYKVNIVPVRLERFISREEIYAILAAAVVGEALKINLVKVTEALKDY